MVRKNARGFTLVELMVVVVIIGMLASVAIPSYIKYLNKARTTEARTMVKVMYDGARTYYLENSQFPGVDGTDTGPTPALGTCCLTGGQCLPNPALWTDEVWINLKFSMADAHLYSYRYNSPLVAKQGASFYGRAYGDLDCDGRNSTFSMHGAVESAYAGGPSGTAAIYREAELE